MCGSRRKKRKGRRSVWEERHANDLVDAVISSSDYAKKKLIFTEKKNSNNAEIYANVLKELVQRYWDGSFPFSVDQRRNKFKKCVSLLLMRKNIWLAYFLTYLKLLSTVHRSILVGKLEHYGIRGLACNYSFYASQNQCAFYHHHDTQKTQDSIAFTKATSGEDA